MREGLKRAALATTFLLLPLLAERSARACGAAFFEDPTTVHVTAHRMAISIATDRTIIWDQIQYQGDPKDFAFVFPVPPGSSVELGDDAWLTALDAYTSPVIYAPRDSSHGGCALMGCAATENTTAGNASAHGNGPNAALSIGPYEVAIVTPKTSAELLGAFTQAGLTVPSGADAIVSSYLAAGMSFVVMHLRPGCGERSIVPVRIVMPGSHPTVPLRLASIGSSGAVDVEIFVLGEQRWAPQSYPQGTLDFSALRADSVTNNYEELASGVFAAGQGRTFITELAAPASDVSINQTDLRTTVASFCAQVPPGPSGATCTGDSVDAAADPFFDAAAMDASDHGAAREGGSGNPADSGDDAGGDGGEGGPAMWRAGLLHLDNAGAPHACTEPSDLTRATERTPLEQLYITRLRARIPVAQIAQADLTLRPWLEGDGPVRVSQYHQALATPTGDVPTSNPEASCGTASGLRGTPSVPASARDRLQASHAAAVSVLAFLMAVILRRRGRP